ncbi:hypothetical protein [Fastidiosipila sanguinis]|uniref:Uncharacterized protein n=1 Tax=Fastidiosipila sanguinis TaxID=236753 RepID=A0A2S0KPG4_9FIRM|nr:hypothetical protein [Fastidiosipila sanguinis]AVM42922.1 hypothetical protein C5Q98_06735 [Fastidiosipila sanguinis]
MRFEYNNEEISEEDLIAIFPRRIQKVKNFEVWQYPYIVSSFLYKTEDYVILEFNEKQDIIHVISTNKDHLNNRFHLDRISNLIHDISLNFDFKLYYIDNDDDDQLWNLWDNIIKK